MATRLLEEWWCVNLGQTTNYSPVQFDRIAEAFFRFTPDVVVGDRRIFLEMSRTKKLFKLNSISKRVAVIAAREGLDAQDWKWGAGQTLPEAWVHCRYGTDHVSQLPLEAIFHYIDPYRQAALSQAQEEKMKLFFSLGLSKLEQVFSIPHDALLVRFGNMLDQFSKNYHQGQNLPWIRFKPEVELSVHSQWNADEWASDADSLIFKLKPLIEQLMTRLYSQRRSLKQGLITLKLDSQSADREFPLQFTFPQTSSQLLLKLLREQITRAMQDEPLTGPVMSAEIKVIETAERDQRSLRFSFSNPAGPEGEGLREKWMELISYLGSAFQVETTEHLLPEKSWRKLQSEDFSADLKLDRVSHLFQKRPFKLFAEPIALARVGKYLKKNQELWRIQEFNCEEKIKGYEWDVDSTQGFDRTYYRVKVESDHSALTVEEWWIFKDEKNSALLLHGVYC